LLEKRGFGTYLLDAGSVMSRRQSKSSPKPPRTEERLNPVRRRYQTTTHGDSERRADAVRGYLSRTTPVVPPIYQCTTFELDEDSYRDIIEGVGSARPGTPGSATPPSPGPRMPSHGWKAARRQ